MGSNTSTAWNRLRLSQDITYRLRNLKGRLGVTPNLLCRVGFCLSLSEASIPSPDHYDEEGPEFNRSTLLGEHELLFDVMLKERLAQDGLDPAEHYLPQLRAHMNRGADMICSRVRSLADILALVPLLERSDAA